MPAAATALLGAIQGSLCLQTPYVDQDSKPQVVVLYGSAWWSRRLRARRPRRHSCSATTSTRWPRRRWLTGWVLCRAAQATRSGRPCVPPPLPPTTWTTSSVAVSGGALYLLFPPILLTASCTASAIIAHPCAGCFTTLTCTGIWPCSSGFWSLRGKLQWHVLQTWE